MIRAIFACDANGGLGFEGTLPWPHHSEDLEFFKTHTHGDVVVMGRKTWDDPAMPKPLPGRTVFVASSKHKVGTGAVSIQGDIVSEIKNLAVIYPDKDIWIIGGKNLLLQVRDLLDEIYLTHFKGSYRVDVQLDLRKYLQGFIPRSASVSRDFKCSWVIYKNENIFRKP